MLIFQLAQLNSCKGLTCRKLYSCKWSWYFERIHCNIMRSNLFCCLSIQQAALKLWPCKEGEELFSQSLVTVHRLEPSEILTEKMIISLSKWDLKLNWIKQSMHQHLLTKLREIQNMNSCFKQQQWIPCTKWYLRVVCLWGQWVYVIEALSA